MDIQWLTFDLDDTLIDNKESIRFAFRMVCESFQIPFSETLFLKWSKFDCQYWKHYRNLEVPKEIQQDIIAYTSYVRMMRFTLFFPKYQEYSQEMSELYLRNLGTNIVPMDKAQETLQSLSLKYPIFVATNGPSLAAKEKIGKIGCDSYIQGIFSADMTKSKATKQYLEFFQEYLIWVQKFHSSKGLFIGDSYAEDVLMAKKAGFHTAWFHPINTPNEADKQIRKLSDLKKFL